MLNPNQPNNLDQFKPPVPAMEDVAAQQIQNHEYDGAYNNLSKAEFADAHWNDLSKRLDMASLPENSDKKQPLTPDEYEVAQREELNKAADAYGVEADNSMKAAEDFVVMRKEINKLIEELLDAIKKARKQAKKVKENRATITLFPLIGSIFGIVKTRKLKKLMVEVGQKQQALKDKQEELKARMEIDQLSPAFDHKAMIASGMFETGFIFTDSLALGIGGAVFDVIGTLNAFESHEQLVRLDIKLEDFEKILEASLESNTDSIVKLENYRGVYREGVIENARSLAA